MEHRLLGNMIELLLDVRRPKDVFIYFEHDVIDKIIKRLEWRQESLPKVLLFGTNDEGYKKNQSLLEAMRAHRAAVAASFAEHPNCGTWESEPNDVAPFDVTF